MSTKKQDKNTGSSQVNGQTFSLMLYNDNYHTHEYVIDALVKICGHDIIQATQCTFLAHFNEKCEIKRGPKTVLAEMQRALIRQDLRVVID